jgi:hypothetical protein
MAARVSSMMLHVRLAAVSGKTAVPLAGLAIA